MSKNNYKIYTSGIPQGQGIIKKESKWFLFFYHIGNLIFQTCYHSGLLIVKTVAAASRRVARDISETVTHTKLRVKKIVSPEFYKTIVVFLFICLLSWGAFSILSVLANGLQIKTKILSGAELGLQYIAEAQELLSKQDYIGAKSKLESAVASFEQSKHELQNHGVVLNNILSLVPQTQDAKNILDAATLASESGQDMIHFSEFAKQVRFSPEGIESDSNTTELFGAMRRSLTLATDKLNQANQKLSKVAIGRLPNSREEEFLKLSEKLSKAQSSLNSFQSVYEVVYGLLMGQKNVLLVFENNNELRPGGGFMGTFGRFSFDNGKIKNLHISSIYDLDGQLKKNIIPPNPVLYVNTRWFLRDSNWFVDFTENAKKISSFYELEGGETPDVVIAMTPDVITSLLEITGPVSIPTYNVELSADNFVEKAQAVSTMSDSSSLNTPKQVLADFFPILIQKISELPSEQMPKIFSSLSEQLQRKQITLFSRDENLQKLLAEFNWAGIVAKTDRDYLQVNLSNLGGTKTDRDLKITQNLVSSIDSSGQVTNKLTITIKNPLPKLPQTQHTAFVRVLVPEGSVLVDSEGFTKMPESPKPSPFAETDEDVLQWEKSTVKNLVTGTLMGTEADKSFFANWIVIPGEEEKVISFSYKLPFTVQKLDRYSLSVQKQMGSQDAALIYNINFPGRTIEWKNFEQAEIGQGSSVISTVLDKDRFFGIVLKGR